MTPTAAILDALRASPGTLAELRVRTGLGKGNAGGTLNRLRLQGVVVRTEGVWSIVGEAQAQFTCALLDAWPMPVAFPPLVPSEPRLILGVLHTDPGSRDA